MICEAVRELLSAWRDGELDAADRAVFDSHIAGCDACRAEADALARQDVQLRALFDARSAAVPRIIATVERQLAEHPSAIIEPTPRRIGIWRWLIVSHLLCMAAGFSAAAFLGSRRSPDGNGTSNGQRAGTSDTAPAVAILVLATGPVEFRTGRSGEWTPCPTGFGCPADSSVRTTADSLCEWKTADNSVLRLDRATELELSSPRTVTLRQGRVWCQAADNRSLEVRATEGQAGEPPSPFSCTGEGATWSMRRAESAWECLSAGGDVSVAAGGEIRRLTESAAVRLDESRRLESMHVDPTESKWMMPLLMRRGPENPELQRYVDRLLSLLGRTKVAYLEESEIRSLGEFGALPLLRFVSSPEAKQDVSRRISAMRILADVAPVTFIPEFIGLLEDDSPNIRILSATVLKRLTGLNQGRIPADWKEQSPENDAALQAWRAWWEQNRTRFPATAHGRPAS